jgi:DNA-binding SARP family transcriptional activator
MLQVHLLGAFNVTSERRKARTELGGNGRRLAAYLFTFPNRVHRREKLVDLFWPEADPAQGRAAFSTAMWRLRCLTSEAPPSKLSLRAFPREICLQLSDPGLVDAHHFRSAALEALSSDGRTPDFEALGRAASLYDGPFLEEYDEDWVLDQREQLQSLYIRALRSQTPPFASLHDHQGSTPRRCHCRQTA